MLLALVLSLLGTSALVGPPPATQGHMSITRTGPVSADVDFWETRGGSTVRSYDVDMTKRLHLIVVSSNFETFQHVHPTFHPDGHFTLPIAFGLPGTYEMYADTVPHGDVQTVFRFSTHIGTNVPGDSVMPIRGSRATVGPYVVALDSLRIEAGSASHLRATITRDGKPATDLTAYLGAAAHIVLIDEKTLAYVHVHPETPGMSDTPGMAMDAMPELAAGTHVAPTMDVHAHIARPGTYRMWLKFRGGNALYVAPFILTSR